jgi:small subunit ribosomal protein S21
VTIPDRDENHSETGARMTQVVLGENEGIDSALRRFKTPQEKRKRKAVAARRKKRFR